MKNNFDESKFNRMLGHIFSAEPKKSFAYRRDFVADDAARPHWQRTVFTAAGAACILLVSVLGYPYMSALFNRPGQIAATDAQGQIVSTGSAYSLVADNQGTGATGSTQTSITTNSTAPGTTAFTVTKETTSKTGTSTTGQNPTTISEITSSTSGSTQPNIPNYNIKVGEIYSITLLEHSGGGYRWNCSISPSDGITATYDVVILNPEVPGSSCNITYNFLAEKAGVYIVNLKETRPWESDSVKPLNTQIFSITVTN